MRRKGLVRRMLATAFVFFGTLAVLLNVLAASDAVQRGLWGIAAGYVAIATGIGAALALAWYSHFRQSPYQWRGEGLGHREPSQDGVPRTGTYGLDPREYWESEFEVADDPDTILGDWELESSGDARDPWHDDPWKDGSERGRDERWREFND